MPIALLDIPAEAGEVYVGRFSQLDPAWRRPRGAAAGPVFADPERPGQWVGAEAGCHDQAQFCEYWRGFLKPFNLVHHAGFYLEEPGGWTLLFDFHRGRRARAFDRLETARMHVVARYLHARVAARWTPALPTRASAAPARLLSAREAEVAAAVAAGLSNKDVAAALDISVRTVENHMRSIFDKLEVGSRTQLAASVLRLYQDMRQ